MTPASRAFLVLAVLSAAPVWAQAPSTLWKARGLEAAEKLEAITPRMSSKDKSDAKRATWEGLLEAAYALHVARPEVVRKVTGKNEAFHLILSAGEAGLLDVVYLYSPKTGENHGLRVDRLPTGWQVLLIKDALSNGMIGITPDEGAGGVLLLFSIDRPLEASVVITPGS